ncbi:sigma-54-dependent Fis family transcriptional regulator [Fusibacter ferrireducens]|uniref:Sigma 54-interacting transcriptional regulator n=1 Tax=Fusibacter ferrireducens TaxID=2785058 RepID=A0ABR9ZVJ4_9FIRM|nr:sigma 54-interacting transcriptional regulator [Fusibacter ferrireducens]MBF4694188.1 sigma 54-interacting transcriptional regulator [Fusibacter ferrireducens]
MIKLTEIKHVVQNISEAIASVLNMDVIISDNEFNKIGDTKKHFDLEVLYIKDTYVIGSVLKSGKPVIVTGKEDNENCVVCKEKNKCNLQAMICVPIKYNNFILGAIGLIAISLDYRKTLLDNQDNLIEFLNRMADLIVSKVLEQEASDKLQVAINQMMALIDSVDEGIIAVDEYGTIIYKNSVINDMFLFNEAQIEKQKIFELLPKPYIEKLVHQKETFNNIELSIAQNQHEYHTLVSGKPVLLGTKSAGSILIFKKMEDIYNVVNTISLNNQSTLFEDIIGEGPEIKLVKDRAKLVANSNSTVLILGESGTGKELFARAIHYSSDRHEKPFIAFNCAAIPESLLESELFGYEAGSFTGATKGGKLGKFQLAQGGTIFLDEIGDVPIHLQTKLLRVLQEKSLEKLGGHKSVELDIRVIAATNKYLEQMVIDGSFREDLFYRLSVIPINIPPLRERKGDIKILLNYFLKHYNQKLRKNIKGFHQSAEEILLHNSWKGNVRELENVIEYAVNMETSPYITLNSIPQRIRVSQVEEQPHMKLIPLEEMERNLIYEALEVYGHGVQDKTKVAQVLGIGIATLYRKIKKYDL